MEKFTEGLVIVVKQDWCESTLVSYERQQPNQSLTSVTNQAKLQKMAQCIRMDLPAFLQELHRCTSCSRCSVQGVMDGDDHSLGLRSYL